MKLSPLAEDVLVYVLNCNDGSAIFEAIDGLCSIQYGPELDVALEELVGLGLVTVERSKPGEVWVGVVEGEALDNVEWRA